MKKEGTCDWIIWHILLTLQVNKKVGTEYNQRTCVQSLIYIFKSQWHILWNVEFEKQVFVPIKWNILNHSFWPRNNSRFKIKNKSFSSPILTVVYLYYFRHKKRLMRSAWTWEKQLLSLKECAFVLNIEQTDSILKVIVYSHKKLLKVFDKYGSVLVLGCKIQISRNTNI